MFRNTLIKLFLYAALPFATASAISAQEVWVQIEANDTLSMSNAQAAGYDDLLDNVNAFEMGRGWYAIALGPYDAETARSTLTDLRGQGLIPRDSYISDGSIYGAQIWPQNVTPTSDLAEIAPPVPQATEVAPLPVTLKIETAPTETLAQAQRSEAALSRAEKMDLQRALQWFGHYDAAIDGAYGRGTRASMSSWQEANALEVTGVLTTVQRAQLLAAFENAQEVIGFATLLDEAAGITLDAPMGLVAFDRAEAPFSHYSSVNESGVRMVLISQSGDRARMGGLYEILQTLDDVPTDGKRSINRQGFEITGISEDFQTEIRVSKSGSHIYGFMLVWPNTQDTDVTKVIDRMQSGLSSTGKPMPDALGYDPDEQEIDLVSGLQIRKPTYSRSGLFVSEDGLVLTTSDFANGCNRITLNQLYDAKVVYTESDLGLAVLKPENALAPRGVAIFSSEQSRLRSQVTVAGFPFEGALGAATLTFGTLEDVSSLSGDTRLKRLAIKTSESKTGGPVFTPSGTVSGILQGADMEGALLPKDVAFAVKSGEIVEMLKSQKIAVDTSQSKERLSAEALSSRARDVSVLVSCWTQ